jgi:hypothetical protein
MFFLLNFRAAKIETLFELTYFYCNYFVKYFRPGHRLINDFE